MWSNWKNLGRARGGWILATGTGWAGAGGLIVAGWGSVVDAKNKMWMLL